MWDLAVTERNRGWGGMGSSDIDLTIVSDEKQPDQNIIVGRCWTYTHRIRARSSRDLLSEQVHAWGEGDKEPWCSGAATRSCGSPSSTVRQGGEVSAESQGRCLEEVTAESSSLGTSGSVVAQALLLVMCIWKDTRGKVFRRKMCSTVQSSITIELRAMPNAINNYSLARVLYSTPCHEWTQKALVPFKVLYLVISQTGKVLIQKGTLICLTELEEVIWQQIHVVLWVKCVVYHLRTQLVEHVACNSSTMLLQPGTAPPSPLPLYSCTWRLL